jgi:hypothetical protein
MNDSKIRGFDRSENWLVGGRFWKQSFIQFILTVGPHESGRDESDPKRKTEDRHYDGNLKGKTPNAQRSSYAGALDGLGYAVPCLCLWRWRSWSSHKYLSQILTLYSTPVISSSPYLQMTTAMRVRLPIGVN